MCIGAAKFQKFFLNIFFEDLHTAFGKPQERTGDSTCETQVPSGLHIGQEMGLC
jgi:hypothetical protein